MAAKGSTAFKSHRILMQSTSSNLLEMQVLCGRWRVRATTMLQLLDIPAEYLNCIVPLTVAPVSKGGVLPVRDLASPS